MTTKIYTEELKAKHQKFFDSREFDEKGDMIKCNLKLRDELYKIHENLIYTVIRPWGKNKANGDFANLYQDAGIALLKAIDRFDPSIGTTFSTFAFAWLRQAVFASWADMIPPEIRRMRFKIAELLKQDKALAETYQASSSKEKTRQLFKFIEDNGEFIEEQIGYNQYQLLQVRTYTSFAGDDNVDNFEFASEEEPAHYGALSENLAQTAVECLKKLSVKQRQVLLMRLKLIDNPEDEKMWFEEPSKPKKPKMKRKVQKKGGELCL
jgi:RNA polymerase sigma factor (sigma-70 family)